MAREIKLPLTDQQEKALYFIIEYIEEYDYPPTINEIKEALNHNNPGYVHKILTALEKKGYITRRKRIRRGLRLTEISENMSPHSQWIT